MNNQGGNFTYDLAIPTLNLQKVFMDIKTMQRDNLSDMAIEQKDEKTEQEVKGLKFIAKKIKILLQKNKKIQYNEASRILINNFANEEKGQRNIKRRVYDAINVLVSAGVITKNDNKIQLISEKKYGIGGRKVESGARDKIGVDERQSSVRQAIQDKIRLKNELKSRLKLLKKIYNGRIKKNKKEAANTNELYVIPWQGVISDLAIEKKKKLNIVVKGGKIGEKPQTLQSLLCKPPVFANQK